MKTQYFFHSRTKPRVTVGAVLNPSTQTFSFGTFIFENKPFCKRIGREAAIGRVLKGKVVATASYNNMTGEIPGRVFVQKALEICNEIATIPNVEELELA